MLPQNYNSFSTGRLHLRLHEGNIFIVFWKIFIDFKIFKANFFLVTRYINGFL